MPASVLHIRGTSVNKAKPLHWDFITVATEGDIDSTFTNRYTVQCHVALSVMNKIRPREFSGAQL